MSQLKQLHTDHDDPVEAKLYSELLNAHHAFLKYKIKKIAAVFPTNVRYDDTWRFKYDPIDDIPSKKKVSTRDRKKLALRFHPDKCKEKDAERLFSFVWDSDDAVVDRILMSDDPVKELRSTMETSSVSEKERDINNWVNGHPYNWFYSRCMYVTDQEYMEKKEEAEKFRREREVLYKS
jgi:hypothetical protein